MKYKKTILRYKFYSIRSKLLFSFSIFILIIIIVIGTNLIFEKHRSNIGELIATLNDIDKNLQIAHKLQSNFIKDETINTDFYISGQSQYLNDWKTSLNVITANLLKLSQLEKKEAFGIKQNIEKILIDLEAYENGFEKLVEEVKYRGFKDYGLEGEMRNFIHQLEKADYPLNQVIILTARRHEKDFILRKEKKYVDKLDATLNKLEKDIYNKVKNKKQRDKLLRLLIEYDSKFKKLVTTEEKIGFDNQSGLRGVASQMVNVIEQEVSDVTGFSIEKGKEIRNRIQMISIIVMLFCLSFGIFLAIFIPRIISRPITRLSRSIHDTVKDNFSEGTKVAKIRTRDEVGRLSRDCAIMLKNMKNSIHKVKKTSEKIEKKQALLMSSIRYAQQIQYAILPHSEDFRNYFQDYFLIYKPLHVVSGDFYWMIEKHNKLFLAVVDCTGHGVPGAFMSMIGCITLNKIVSQDKIYEPDEILEKLDEEIKEALRQEKGSNNDDGMDISLLRFENYNNDSKEIDITFCGAKSHFIYTKKDVLFREKGSRRAIGGKKRNTVNTDLPFFNTFSVTLEKGEFIYLNTDGFTDLHNKRRKKLGNKQMMNLLSEVCHLDLKTQEQKITDVIEKFTEGETSRDDITFLALKI